MIYSESVPSRRRNPPFPDQVLASNLGRLLHPAFPGRSATERTRPKPTYMPKVRRAPTDLDKRRFIREAFDIVAEHFEGSLRELAAHNKGIEHDFTRAAQRSSQQRSSLMAIVEPDARSGSARCWRARDRLLGE